MGKNNPTSAWNVAWIQPDGPGTTPRILTCFAADSITVPRGSYTRNMCWNSATGKYETVGITQDPPDMPSVSLEGLSSLAASYMEKAVRKDCPVYVYVLTTKCPPRGTFVGFDRGRALLAARVESEEASGVLARESHEVSTDSYDFVLEGVEKFFKLAAYRKTTTAAEDGRSIVFVGGPRCQGDCGPSIDDMEIGYVGLEAQAAATADMLYTIDGGATWATTSADPLAGLINGLHISSVVGFPMGGNTYRLLAAQGVTSAGVAPSIGYADVDIIATPATTAWTLVIPTGAPLADFFPFNGSLFALNEYNIWAGTDAGEIYFSSDGGASYTLQLAAIGDMIRCIRFLDEDNGVYVGGTTGASNVMGYTTDGGTNWNTVTITGIGATVMINSIVMFSEQQWMVGDEGGAIWRTWDRGQTAFTQMPQPSVTGLTAWGDINKLSKVDECCIWAAAQATISAADKGVIMRTVNGGYDWETWVTATGVATTGMQDVWGASYNEALAVGDVETTTEIYEVTD